MKNPRFPWRRLGGISPRELTPARRELHFAAQLVSEAGRSYLPARADDSHSSFRWIAGADLMAGEPIRGSGIFRLALRPGDVSLAFLGPDDTVTAGFDLRGRTLAQAADWIRTELARRGAEPGLYSQEKPYELDAHPLLEGGAFTGSPARAFAELSIAWADAAGLQEEIAARTTGATEVRLWPHHFDVGFLILLDSKAGPETARTIGVGLSPGDDGVPEPYFYVTPSPAAPAAELPPLRTRGAWHTEGWTGAILTATELAAEASASSQEAVAREFLAGAVAACRALLGEP